MVRHDFLVSKPYQGPNPTVSIKLVISVWPVREGGAVGIAFLIAGARVRESVAEGALLSIGGGFGISAV